MKTITGTLYAFLSPYSMRNADDVHEATTFTPFCFGWDSEWSTGYTLVGSGEFTLALMDKKAIVSSKVEALKAELQKDLAESEVRQNALRDNIQSLLAITYEPVES